MAHYGFGYTWGQSAAIGAGIGLGAGLFGLGGLSIVSLIGTSLLTTTGAAWLTSLGTAGFAFYYWPTMSAAPLGAKLRDLWASTADDAEADRIAAAIAHTFNNDWRWTWNSLLFGAKSQRCKGIFCFEWAYAFDDAFHLEASGSTNFSATVENAVTSDGRVHYWIHIRSLNDLSKSVYVDDGFWDWNYVHDTPPCGGAYHFQPTLSLGRHDYLDEHGDRVQVPPAYDANNNVHYNDM